MLAGGMSIGIVNTDRGFLVIGNYYKRLSRCAVIYDSRKFLARVNLKLRYLLTFGIVLLLTSILQQTHRNKCVLFA